MRSHQALAPGTRLAGGQYAVKRVLGAGGFGVVYLASGRKKKLVAVKELFPKDTTRTRWLGVWTRRRVRPSANWPRLLEQMRQEHRILAPLRHPHILRVFDIFGENNTLYLVMEYLAGGSLEDRLAQSPGGLPEAEVVSLALALGSALDFAHRQNVLHRDIKPANILYRVSGEPVLVDFGLAAVLRAGGNRSASGTTAFMAPEQAQGETQRPATDLYALGATLVTALTGTGPPPAEARLRGEPFELPGESRLVQTLRRTLVLDPRLRTPGARAFLADLSDEPVEEILSRPFRPARRRRRARVAVWVILLLVTLAVGVKSVRVISATRSQKVPPARPPSPPGP